MSNATISEKQAEEMTSSLPLMRRMIKTYIRPRGKTIFFAMILMLISAAMTGIMAKLMEPIIDKVFADKESSMLLPVAAGVFMVFTLRGAANYGQTVLMNMLGQRIVSDMQQDLFSHLVYADLSFLQKEYSGHLMSRFMADIGMIRAAMVESLTGMGKNAFTVIFLIIVMFMQDWKLAISSLFVFPLAAYAVSLLGKKLRKVSASMQVSMGDFSSALGQAFQGSRHIKSYGMEEHEKTRVFGFINRVCKLMNRSYRFSAIATPVGEILSGIAIVTIIIYGGHEVITGQSTAGKLFSFITAFLLAFEPMKRLAKLNNSMQMGLAGLDRLFNLLDMKPEITDKPEAPVLVLKDKTVTFDNVVFQYPDGTLALDGLSFTAPAGKTVALVGESGAGKSTILNLIPRFYDVTKGSVQVGGHDVRDVTMKSLRAQMALVSQEVAIFTDTLRENIAYGKPDATEEEIIAAAKQAAAHDFIMELPKGYDTHVGEQGVKLSGGQRQRISIARAMLRNAPILLLDEATSALDAHSERFVQAALDRLQKDRTTIVVAHRLSTIMDADIIYVMSNGKVVENGTHDSLLKQGGAYARLYGTMMRETA